MLTNMLTMGQVVPWIPSQSCTHTGTCANWINCTCAPKAILYNIMDKLGKIKQAMLDVLRRLYLPYCLGSTLPSLLASRTSLGATAFLAKF